MLEKMTNNNEELLAALEGLCDEVTWLTYRKSGNKGLRNANLKAIKAIETLRNHLTAPLDEDRQRALEWLDQREEYLLDRIDNGISEMEKSRKSRLKCIATIRQALQQPPAQGWRAIDSAPRDGTVVAVKLISRANYEGEWHKAYYAPNGEWYVYEIGYLEEHRLSAYFLMPPPKENEDE